MKIEKTWNFDIDGTRIHLTEEDARALYAALDAEFGTPRKHPGRWGNGREWTEADTEQLRSLLAEGRTYAQAAAAMNRTRQGCYEHAKRHGFRSIVPAGRPTGRAA